MAFGLFRQKDGSHLTQYLIVASATITMFTTGIHIGWLAPTLPKLLSAEYPYKVTAEEASYIAIISPLGHVAGGFLGSYLNDNIGRRKTLLLTAVPQIISFVMVSCSFYGKYFLYVARVIGGLSEGAAISFLSAYVSEITEPSVRGMLGTMVSVTCISGYLFINILGSYVNIYATASVCLMFPILFLVTFYFTPESPYYLLMKNDTEKAESSLKILRNKTNVSKELMQLKSDVDRQMSETGKYIDIFTIDSNRKAFCMAVVTRIIQQLSGTTAFGAYFQLLLGQATDISPVLGSSLLTVVQIVCSISCSFYINYVGRKALLAWSSCVTSLSLAAFAIHVTLRDCNILDLSHVSWLPLVYLFVTIVAIQCGLGVGVNIYIGEIFSTSIKAKALSLMSIVFALSTLVTTKFYQFTADNFGLAVPLWTFAISTFLGTWFFAFGLLETKGKTLETIQQELKGNKSSK